MEDSLHFEEHFEEDLSFENKYSDFFYSELEDPNSSDKTSKTANFCLGKETEKCQEVSISNVLPAEHILPHSFEGKIFPNEDQRPKPVTKVSKKNSHHYRRNNIWTHPKRKRRRLRSQMQIKTTSDNEVLVTTKEKVLPEVVLPEQAASSANNLPSPTLSPNSVPVPDQPPVTLTIDHTYSKDVSHMEVSPLAEHSKDKGGRSKKNHVIGSLFRKPGRPVGSTNRRKGSKGSSDARQQPRRRAKSSQESSQNQNDNSVALEDSLQTVECQEVSQLEESTPELTIQTDLSPKKVTESPNNESLEKLNDILKPQNSSEITRSEQIPKPLLLRKDLFPERDKNHSDTDLHQKLIDNNSASTNRKQKCGKSKQHFEFTSVWKRSRKNKNTKTPSAGQRKSSRATKPIKEEPKSSEIIIPDKLESEDDDMNIVITKVVSFNSDPKMASNFIKNEVKQEPGCSSGNDEDVEYMTWTIPQEWTEGLIEANEEEATSSETGKQKKSKEVSRKMAISPRYKKGSFPCSSCGKIYAYMRGLRQHQRLECNKEPQFPCPYCPTKYRYPQNVRDHIRAAHAKAFSYWYSIHYQNLLRKKGIDY